MVSHFLVWQHSSEFLWGAKVELGKEAWQRVFMKYFFPFFVFLAFLPRIGMGSEFEVVSLESTRDSKVIFLNPDYLVSRVRTAKGNEKIPLLIYLHGAGGVGEDPIKNRNRARGLIDGILRFEKGPCLVVVPQCRTESARSEERGTWESEDLDLFLEDVLEKFPDIDADRVYLTGNSMGGYGAWMWGGRSPHHFAAIAPIVGGIGRGGPKDVTPDLEEWAQNLAKVPLWAFAGALDKVVPAERSERMIQAIRKAGGTKARILVYPEEGHGASRSVLRNKEFFDWMFSQVR